MGACCSSNSTPAKDPEDKTLDDVDVVWTWVSQFDDIFTNASEPLNTAVTLNNGIVTSVEKIKEAAAAIFGAHFVKVEVENNQIKIGVFTTDDDGNESKLSDEQLTALFNGDGGADFRGSWQTVVGQVEPLNQALTAAPAVTVEVKKARLFFKVGESKQEDEANISAARARIAGFNNTVFRAKLNLTALSAKDALNPKRALQEIFSNIKKHVSSFVPVVDVDLAGIAEGNVRFDIRPPSFDVNVLPHKIRTAYLAIFGDSSWDPGLVATIKETVEQLSGLLEQIKGIQEAIEGLPKDPNEMIDAAKSAGLSAYWAMKVPGRVATNSAALAQAPVILNQLIDTIRWVVDEVQGAVSEIP